MARDGAGRRLLVVCIAVVVTSAVAGPVAVSGAHADPVGTALASGASVNVTVDDLAGSGTAGDPYVITNASELQAMEDDLDAHYVLGSDVDASGTAAWNDGSGFDPIGSSPVLGEEGFTGSLDGAGHTITGLTINRSGESDVGLFAGINETGTVENLTLAAVNVTGAERVGALAGTNEGTVVGTAVTGTVDGGTNTGGLVGLSVGGEVRRAATGATVSGHSYTGGLVGHNEGGTVRNSSSAATVTGTSVVGSLVGYNEGGTVAWSYAGGSANGTAAVGGLVGSNTQHALVTRSYATGNATAVDRRAGGLVAANIGSSAVTRSYATGIVTAPSETGGLVGVTKWDATVNRSYWDVKTTGQSTSAGGTALDTAAMTGDAAPGNMSALDFSTVWWSAPDAYPALAWQDVAVSAPANDPPTARPERYSMLENETLSVAVPGVLENDTDPQGDPLSVGLAPDGGPSHGNLTLDSDGSFTYVPAPEFDGQDAFTYRASDGSNGTDTATVAVQIIPVGNEVDVDPADLPGNGTGENPYVITNASELQAMEDDLTANYTLGGDVDASGTADWNNGSGFDPIGTTPFSDSIGFNGSFDGAGHTITGLTIDRPDEEYLGVFGGLEKTGAVENVALVEVDVNGLDYVGALVGANAGTIYSSDVSGAVNGTAMIGGLVGYSYSSGLVNASSSTATVTGEKNVGGLVGSIATGAVVERSTSSGTVAAGKNAGGLVGKSFRGTVTESRSEATVTGDRLVGGLLGSNFEGTVTESDAAGTVDGSIRVGGLVGGNIYESTIRESYATGSVNGSEHVGGLVGDNGATVTESFAAGPVNGSTETGGLVGSGDGSTSGSYWDVNATGQNTSAGGTGLTTAEMIGTAAPGNTTAFDFPEDWQTRPGDYPGLDWQVNDVPIPDIGVNRWVLEGWNVTLDASGSSDDHGITSHEWDVDGDGTYEYTGEQVTHAFSESGNRTVRLRITDDDGVSNTTERTVRVVPNRSLRLTVHAPQNATVGGTVSMRVEVNETVTRLAAAGWDTDADGVAERTGNSIRTLFRTPGNRTVVVNATDVVGRTTRRRVNVTVTGDGADLIGGHARFRVDAASTGHNPDEVGPVADVSKDWSYGMGGRVFSSPAVADGIVYAASVSTSYGDRIVAVNARDGSLLWQFSTARPVGSNPTVANGTVYIGSKAGILRAFDAETGAVRWSKDTGTTEPAPVVVDGTLYVPGGSKLYALDPDNGSVQFATSTGGGGSSPAVVHGTVYVGGGNDVYAIDAETGTTEWTFGTNGTVESSPAVVDGTVYVGSHDGNLYALNATDGTLEWQFETGNRVRSSPAVANGTVYVGSDDGIVYAVDAASGSQVWAFETYDAGGRGDNRVVSSPVVVSNTVYVGTHGYYVHALDAENGTERWSYLTGFDVVATPAVVDGRVYVGSVDGYLYALSGTVPESARTPTADAGENRTVTENTTVKLDGTGSTDPDGDSLAYAWTQRAGPDVSLVDADTATPTFRAPNVTSPAVLRFAINVSDGNGQSDTDRVTVVVNPNVTGVAAFDETARLNDSRVGDASLVGTIRAERTVGDGVRVNLTRATATNYSLSIDAPDTASNVTFYLRTGAISVSRDVAHLTMYLDGEERPFSLVESAGPDNGSWVAFDVPHFSTRTVTFADDTGTATCVADAVSGSDDRIGLTEIQGAINWWAEGTEVPNTGGETISLTRIQSLINAWAEGATVSCT